MRDHPIDKCRGVKLQHPWVTIQKQQRKVMSANGAQHVRGNELANANICG